MSESEAGAATAGPEAEGPRVVLIGAGPAGLTAAYELSKHGLTATILESDHVVGGISRTVERDGWRFDIGGHRFFTKVRSVDALWFEILDESEFLRRPRLSRIFYRGKLYDYPLKPANALRNLGVVEAVRCVLSYVWVRIKPPKDQSSLEGFVASRFGWRLYEHFFKAYSEKVWGVPASEISADWGAQRIKNLSLFRAAWEAIKPQRLKERQSSSKQVTSLIEEFNYPKYGPGQMWERAAEIVTDRGSELHFGQRVVRIERQDSPLVVVTVDDDGNEHRFEADHVISSMPFGQLVEAMDPPAPQEVLASAKALTHRDFLTVALVVPQEYSFPDNWIYVHDPEVAVGRVQNFGSWSPYLVKEGRTCLGLEYFVNEGDSMWTRSDEELVALATREIDRLGLVDADRVEAGYVVRMPKAYPVYDEHYQYNVEVLREWLEANEARVHPVGRNGMHRYNNQDHSMLTAVLSVENVLGAHHDVWAVNVEAEYHEESADRARESSTGRDAPILPRAAIDQAARRRRGDG